MLTQLYEDFSRFQSKPQDPEIEQNDELEEERLKSFENGYGAGWEDALRAQNEATRRLHDSLEQSLLDLSFTKEEALQSLNASIQPLLTQIVCRILPKISEISLSQHVAGVLQDALMDGLNPPVELHVSADQKTAVARVVSDLLPEGGKVLIDPCLSNSQARIALGVTERVIDLDSLIEKILHTLSEYYVATQQKVENV